MVTDHGMDDGRANLRMAENGPDSERDAQGRFVPGWSGGPGRPPGQPNRTTDDLRRIKAALVASFDEYGAEAIRKVATERPVEYLRLIVSVLPKDSAPESKHMLPIQQWQNAINERRAQAGYGRPRSNNGGNRASPTLNQDGPRP